MVKELIKGILGKKEDSTPTAPANPNDPPDELPPLAEDVVNAEVAKAQAAQKAAPLAPAAAPVANPPDELPTLDFEKAANAMDFSTEADKAQPSAPTDLPAEIQKAKMAKMSAEPKPIEKSDQPTFTPPSTQIGFFSSIIDQVKRQDTVKEKLLDGDLYSRMNNYWELKKHEVKSGSSLSTQDKLEKDLLGVLEELRVLEQKWQVQKMALEEDLKFLEQREREIQIKSQELRNISNELLLFKKVKPEQYFRVRNGVVLKSLHDLLDLLEIIDDETYNQHVANGRNDFANWIREAFMDTKIAEKIQNAKGKAEIITILHSTAPMQERQKKKRKVITPANYFYLANGVVLKSILEFSDALKEMDDDLFAQHVHSTKNDFAVWVQHSFGDEHLAEALNRCHSRIEMIRAIDLYA